MLVFQWNALRVGDHVRVHDDRGTDLRLQGGVVSLVQTYVHRPNEVGIRLDSDPGVIVYPRRHAVHLDRADESLGCWRCATRSAEGVAA